MILLVACGSSQGSQGLGKNLENESVIIEKSSTGEPSIVPIQKSAKEMGPFPQPIVSVLLCPQSNCSTVMVDAVSASTGVACALYSLSDQKVIAALKRANASLVVDHNLDAESLGFVEAVSGPPMHTMHNKFCVIGNDNVLTGSFNPTKRLNKDALILIRSLPIARAYKEEFQELRSGVFGGAAQPENKKASLSKASLSKVALSNGSLEVFFCPDDDCEHAVVDEIAHARNWILLEAYSFTSRAVMQALVKAHERGVVIAGLIEKSQDKEGVAADMQLRGVDIRYYIQYYNAKELMHRKIVVVDGNVLIAGSANPTFSGYHENDENLLIIHDPVLASGLAQNLLEESCNSLDHVMFSKQFLEALKFRC